MSGLYIERGREFHLGRWMMVLLVIGIIGSGGWFGYRWFTTGEKPPLIPLPATALADPAVDETPVSEQQIDDYKVDPTSPRYISIPSIGVDRARVQQVKLEKSGELDMPHNINDAGWYKEGGFPGQDFGQIMIDGHCQGVNHDGIFTKLGNLNEGEQITIERGDGKKYFYTVKEVQTKSLVDTLKTGMQLLATPYDAQNEGLGLITCAGNWVPREGVYDQRILVRAVIQK